MTTYRERRLARAERLRDYADSNERKSGAAYEGAKAVADGIPFGQPILVGHHSESGHRRDIERIDRGFGKAFALSGRAEEQRARADSIEAQAEHAIYSDDEDAVERLVEKIARLEAERERIKAYNASCRKGKPDLSLLEERQRADLESTARAVPAFLGPKGQMPSYALTNLGGNINRLRKRLEQVKRDQAARDRGVRVGGRGMLSRFASECSDCGQVIEKGTAITYYRSTREAVHVTCPERGGGEDGFEHMDD